GILEVDRTTAGEDERRYSLPAARAHVLLQRDSEAYMGAMAEAVVAAATWLPMLEPAYRAGTGVPYAAYGVQDLQAAFSRPHFANRLVQAWLPALPDVHTRLLAGPTRVAEIGCGEGIAAVTLARSFPGAVVDGFDLDDASIAAARRHADEAGVADRVRFEVADAVTLLTTGAYDLVFCVEMLHDTSDPVGVLAAMRRARGRDGAVLVVDEAVAESFASPVEPLERLLYAFSTLHCLPVGLVGQPSAGTGAVMRPAVVRRYAGGAGFRSVQELPVEDPQFRLYRLDG
ncbi:MAG: class I SAM-dependent methyltransferase, partial [Actinomycetes bacterium]